MVEPLNPVLVFAAQRGLRVQYCHYADGDTDPSKPLWNRAEKENFRFFASCLLPYLARASKQKDARLNRNVPSYAVWRPSAADWRHGCTTTK